MTTLHSAVLYRCFTMHTAASLLDSHLIHDNPITMKRTVISLIAVTWLLAIPQVAHAGDGATIVFKSGVMVTLNNGYKQLVDGMKELKTKGSQNFPVEILIEGNSFFVNLGEVAVLCRDSCSSLTLLSPKPQGK